MPDDNAVGSAQGDSSAQDLQAKFEKLQQDYAASSSEAKRLKQERDFFEQQAQTPRQPQQQSNDPMQRLRDEGWPVDTLLPVIEAIADRKANDRLGVINTGLNARSKVLSEYPDYQENEGKVLKFINEDPIRQGKYDAMMRAGMMEEAMDWGFLKFKESQSGQAKGSGSAQTKADAAIPSSRSSDKRNNNNDEGADMMGRARAEFQKTGNPAARDAFVRSRLRQAIPDSFYEK